MQPLSADTEHAAPLLTADGLTLHRRHWPAAPGSAARGRVLIVHGLGEHSGRYQALAEDLAGAGWRVSAYDQRGHGASAGRRGVIAAADSLLADLGRVIDSLRSDPSQGTPGSAAPERLVLLGHSLGGLVAARFAAEALQARPAAWSRPIDALVLSSPALDAGLSAWQRLLVTLASGLAPDLALGNGLRPDWICRDPAVVRAYRDDPLVHDRISGRLAGFIRDSGPPVLALAPQWRLPTLLMWAGADRCVAPAGSADFVGRVTADCLRAQPWPGLAHEILNEPERAQVVAVLLDWLARL